MTSGIEACHPDVSRGLDGDMHKPKTTPGGPDAVLFADRFLGRRNGRSAAYAVAGFGGKGSDAVAA
ncbi:hypothetical protein [Mesorhizobium sp. NZP2298]|uniref:hypothetical protein n=1 Tax=Mesorhizobium sp. NZP2298 TaxID=2483403 RepID=UPI001556B085|nr:hypothetical protein [Mesorhizobium sp. NZP2298]